MGRANREAVQRIAHKVEQGRTTYSLCAECSHTRKGSNKHSKCLGIDKKQDGAIVWRCNHCEDRGSIQPAHFERQMIHRETKMQREYKRPTLPQEATLDLPDKVLQFFDNRGIGESTLRRNKIYFKDGWIAFPFYRDSTLINIKRRNANKDFRQEPNAEKIYYGLDDLPVDCTEVIIVEGEMDKLALNEAGIWNVLSVPDGAPNPDAKMSDKKFEYVGNCMNITDKMDRIILACDNDPNGHALTQELARRYGKDKCAVVEWPKGIKDANEYLIEHDIEELARHVSQPKPWPIEDLFTAGSFTSRVTDIYNNGFGALYSTGWDNIDERFKIRPKELSVVTGIPGSGKSEFIDALAINLAKLHGWKFAICSFENPPEQHIAKLAHRLVGKRFFGGPMNRMSQDELHHAMAWLDEHFLFVSPTGYDTHTDIEWILEKTQYAVKRYGINGLIIDPYNEIDRDYRINETEHVNQMLKKLKRFTHINEIHTWLVAHPAKPKQQDGKEQIPNLYSISGSANFRNRADIGLTVHRERDEITQERSKKAIVEVSKVRFANIVGTEGRAELLYNPETAQYEEDKAYA